MTPEEYRALPLPWATKTVLAGGDKKTPWIYLTSGEQGDLGWAVCDRCRLREVYPVFMDFGAWSIAMNRWLKTHAKCHAPAPEPQARPHEGS